MSNLRIKYLDKEEAFDEILSGLFKIFGEKQYAVYGWGHDILGYGIKQSKLGKDFQRGGLEINERRFKHHKKELLERKFIKVFDKTVRVKKGPFYAITPIGMYYLLSKLEKFSRNTSKNIFKLLKFYTTHSTKTDNTFFKYFDENSINKAIHQLVNQIVFERMDNKKNLIRFNLNFTSNVSIRFLEIQYGKKDITVVWSAMVFGFQKFEKIDENQFNFQIANATERILSFYLFNSMKNVLDIQKVPSRIQSGLRNIIINNLYVEIIGAEKIKNSMLAAYELPNALDFKSALDIIQEKIQEKYKKEATHA